MKTKKNEKKTDSLMHLSNEKLTKFELRRLIGGDDPPLPPPPPPPPTPPGGNGGGG